DVRDKGDEALFHYAKKLDAAIFTRWRSHDNLPDPS
ncbi:unnamed protein product, partial [marine sediment metagenome]